MQEFFPQFRGSPRRSLAMRAAAKRRECSVRLGSGGSVGRGQPGVEKTGTGTFKGIGKGAGEGRKKGVVVRSAITEERRRKGECERNWR